MTTSTASSASTASTASNDAFTGDRINLVGISGYGYHGVYPAERAQGQTFVVDLVCWIDLAEAATGDDLLATVHYAELAQSVVEDIERDPVDLIETLADRIAMTCFARPRVQACQITVHKPQAPMPVTVADVSVTLMRRRST